MTHHTGAVPDTRPPSWLARVACRGLNDLMFPDNHAPGIADAKAVCAGCPVSRECLIDAIRTGDNEHGIRGGLRPDERRKVRQLAGDRYSDATVLAAAVMQVLHPATATRTLREVWEELTYPLPGGHLGWRGSVTFSYQGHSYAPKKTAFQLHRGRDPEGIVRRTCPVVECVNALHLEDNRERLRRKREAERAAAAAAVEEPAA
ncbi:WhiB family transcriptional regulator [Streptomyces sp. NPDC052015]|uniref:WhiB family transcriptional regulator n=1 Tax=Streptomyces sp. NPDC052015 TaxID=3154755 RepID=UPI003437DFFE